VLDNIAFGIVISLLFVSLLVLFCALLIKLYINKIKNYTKVIYQKDLDFQRELNTSIVETQEQVLNNISQDLHDDAGQQLTYINFMLENLKLDSLQLAEILEPVSNAVYQLSNSIRSISHSLNNQLLMQQDLSRAIETETERLQKNGRISINFTHHGNAKAFNTSQKIVIYRIFQEVINNIFKHSGATVIDVAINNEPLFELEIADNGKGFDYDAIKNSDTGLGLNNLVNRAGLIDFTIDIHSVPGKGTIIKLSENKEIL
jgi:signal transduction histidine kinase